MESKGKEQYFLVIGALICFLALVPAVHSQEPTICFGPCNPPILDPIGNMTLDENATLSFTVNAIDPDGGALTYSAAPLPEGATFDASNRTFSWTPTYSQNGTYLINFTVVDTEHLEDTETVTINVTDVNRPPLLNPIGNRTVEEGTLLTFTANASDPDGGDLTYTADPIPWGATFDNRTGEFLWIPSYHQNGTYTMTFMVSDVGNLTDNETITLNVTDVNPLPLLNPIGNRTVEEGTLLTFIVNATDPDGGNLTYSTGPLPQRATFNISDRVFSWVPSYSQNGTYYVNFTVTDAGGLMVYENVTLVVTEPIQGNSSPSGYWPVFEPVEIHTVAETYDLTFTVRATDFDSIVLTYGIGSLPQGASFDVMTGIFRWTPQYGSSGQYWVNFTVSDGSKTDTTCALILVIDQPMPTNDCIRI